MRVRTTALAFLVIPSLLTVIVASPAAAAESTVDYVAMGDSYSSGVGAPGQSGLCLRSSRSYTAQWAQRNDPASYRSVACGGAKTGDVLLWQVPALSSRTDLVTLTIGGNDAGFAETVIGCTVGNDAACAGKVESAREYVTTTLPGLLDRTYRAIDRRAPNARVVVLGYPRLFDETNRYCGIAGLSLAKRKLLNEGADYLSGIIAERAEAAGFTYVDVRENFEGHGACADTPYINALTVVPPTDSFHPNTAGYTSGYLPALTAALN